MENAAVTSATSVRRSTRTRGLGDAPSKSADSMAENSRRRSREQIQEDEGSLNRSSDDDDIVPEEELAPKPKRKRGAAAAARERLNLIEVVKTDEKRIPAAVKQWTERYERNATSAMGELLMMLFEACGAKYHLEADSVDEINVDDVVLALVQLARVGEVEDLYDSKLKELKNFKENLSTFWDTLVLECQNGPLYDKILFEKCIDYTIALSCTPPRVYRQVASLVGLQLVTSFITVAKTLGTQRETTQRQLNAQKKKRNDGPRIESLNKRLSTTHENIIIMEDMMRKLFTGLFMHRYRDIEPSIRMSCIKALGVWILSYPSLFLQDLYLKYLGWTLNDKSAAVRKASVLALQNLYEVDDNVPSLSLFTERFYSRMLELADDIDVSVAVSAIGLLKQLLRHQLLTDDELSPLYDLLIGEPPMIRRAIGELVYDHLIAQKVSGTQSKGEEDESSEVHLGRLLQILREFPTDPILSSYVIDDVWDDMKAMKDWKCIISILLEENTTIELTNVDSTNLVRLLHASAKKAVGEKIVPSSDNRKPYTSKAQKEMLEKHRNEITSALLKSYPRLLQKYAADRAKVSPLVEIIMLLKLDLYTLKRQEQNFKTALDLICDAFFKHGDKDALRSCIKAITFCANESRGELQDFAQNKLKELESDLLAKLKTAMNEVSMGEDEYSLLVNLKRLYELQLTKHVASETLFKDMANILSDSGDSGDEVMAFLLLNMYFHVTWCLHLIDDETPDDASVNAFVSERNILFQHLERFLNILSDGQGRGRKILTSRVCIILAEMWCVFKKSKYESTDLRTLGHSPSFASVKKFWKLCEGQLYFSAETDDEDANEEYIEETNKDIIMIAASKLVVGGAISKDYLGPEILSHFVMHGTSVSEIVKHFITVLKKSADDDLHTIFLEALKRAYLRHTSYPGSSYSESSSQKSLQDCRELALKLSGMFIGVARNKHKPQILNIVRDGIAFAFEDAPNQLPFLEAAVLPFASKLPHSDIANILRDVEKRSENVNVEVDHIGWRPYVEFVNHMKEKCSKNEGVQDGGDAENVKRRGRPRKARNLTGKKLFEEHVSSEDEDSISRSDEEEDKEEEEEDEEEDEHERTLMNSMTSKLRSMKVPQREMKSSSRTPKI